MTIHVVTPGENLTTIATKYDTTPELISSINELPNPENLVVGQSLAIRIPEVVHTVLLGDTLSKLANSYGVTVTQIQQNNPEKTAKGFLVPGDTLIISFAFEDQKHPITINGYAYPFIDRTVLKKTLPFLTYLSIFTYGFTKEGALVPVEDEDLLALA